MKTLPIGQIITDEQHRDAVHIAVCPVEAGEPLTPGEHIAVNNGQAWAGGKSIGIVDPFLKEPVRRKQRFFMFLYPNTITSLRHNWTHPALPEVPMLVTDGEMGDSGVVIASRQWLTEFANRIGETYDELMHHAAIYQQTGEHWVEGSGFGPHDGEDLPDEFWTHWANVTGKPALNFGNFFSCSC